MSTIDHIATRSAESQILNAKGLTFGIVVAEWNKEITEALLDGAVKVLEQAEAKAIKILHVPGAFELVNGATRMKMFERVDAVIVIGCVVRGDTPHFDYICQGVTQGIAYLNTTRSLQTFFGHGYKPVIFGVLTTETMEQAKERTWGTLGNKGEEFAETAIKMCRNVCIVQK